jgi:signal transduction histidine kinase
MKKSLFFLSLAAGFIIIVINIYGFFLLLQRPGLLPEMTKDNLTLTQIEGIRIKNEKLDTEFILSQKLIGDWVTVHIEVDDNIEERDVQLIPYYPKALYPLIYLFIGLFCLVSGILVFLFRTEDRRARIYYWASLALSSALIINSGFFCVRKDWLTYLPGILFYVLFPLSPALLLHFSLSFSKKKIKIGKFLIYGPALIFAAAMEVLFLLSSLKSSIEINRYYQSVIYVHRFYLILFIFLTIICLVISYRKTTLEEEQAQIKWIFYGLFVGLGPFILLYEFPLAIGKKIPLISEELTIVFLIFVPLGFAISIIKYKLMNIELVINRSIVYFILTVFTISIYLFSVTLLQNIFSKFFSVQETVVSVIGALMAAVIFYPARKKIQEFVDKAFYRVSYDYRKSILSFNERARKMANSDHLVDFFLFKVKETLPLDYAGIFIYLLAQTGQKFLIERDGEKNLSSLAYLSSTSDKIYARKKAVRSEENMDFSQEKALEEKKIDLLIPLTFQTGGLAGFLSIGKKKSGERFTHDDLEILLALARELIVNLERIVLQEEVIYERVEKDKLSELIRMKTEFISSVSHELRTPMSSIRGLAEILQAGKIKDKKKENELMRLMADESGRLSRFLHNILDFGKIEKQIKTYHFEKTEIQPVIKDTVNLFQHRLETAGFSLRTDLPDEPLFLEIDQDAIRQALTNLVDNAIKYSSNDREILVSLLEKGNKIEIQVKDKGIGIPDGEKGKIFEGFYRHHEASQHNPKGVGLGLKMVKYIMDAHKGEIKVESQPNKGSTFILVFSKS